MQRASALIVVILGNVSCASAGDPAEPAPVDTPAEMAADTARPPTPTPGTDGGLAALDVPTSARELDDFLQRRSYASWAKESAPHPSAGPHGRLVLTYVNPTLETSLSSGGSSHPRGSASVKEFYSNGQVSGWAVYVKADNDSLGGKNWYWYEVFNAAPGASASQGFGNPVCTGCHAQGNDYVRTPFPLQ